MDEKSIKERFRPLLPKGYIKTIKDRLSKRGINFSKTKIGYVCDPERPDYENEIIKEALDLAAEEKAAQAKAEADKDLILQKASAL